MGPVFPPVLSNQATRSEYRKLKGNTQVFSVVLNRQWGKMNNDPTDSAMVHTDFSLPIISCVWIAAAMATLHFIVSDWVEGVGRGLGVPCVCQNLIYVLMNDSIFMQKSPSHTLAFLETKRNCWVRALGVFFFGLQPCGSVPNAALLDSESTM